ncbi:hypothetical protein GLOTRDRAFT_36223 [Gloeophyllum trabeum ATCC 11539]|uniref:Uncharacterized protein n=1 Tax=Gloeophyllum trabeum (strain ATCC 11539 / FP-39264 / Madison 617) TaxID=670483 RepID=S7QCY1_GLOTA|nr:uncharacterized protein GLOTRDRAFT_36223 [Gloeophyllum trabeum ATCC 11539]EPQ57726.1 hypothetical protein GLOTRDRAFT_36223 [Gloeophyllum trabeum ATCC 11539]
MNCQINRHLKGVVDGSVLLQYKIELGVAGMVDGPPSHVTIGERWNRVRTHTDSWSGLSFETVQEIPCQKASRLQLYGNILARCVGKSTLAFNLLPGHARGISAKEWRFENFSFSIEDYVIDPVQDLLIVLPAQDAAPPRLYLSSLSTGEPHPLALESELSYPSGLIYDHFKLYLSGGFLGAQFRPAGGEPTEHLIVWSWKDGSICLVPPSAILAFPRINACYRSGYATYVPVPTLHSWATTCYWHPSHTLGRTRVSRPMSLTPR